MTEVLNETIENVQGAAEGGYLSALVGEGKKYRNAEELAKAYQNAVQHMEEIKQEKHDLERYDNTMRQILDKLNADEFEPEEESSQAPGTPAAPKIGPEDVKKTVETLLSEREQTKMYKDNEEKSWELLDKEFGDRAKAKHFIGELIYNNRSLQDVIDHLGRTSPDSLVRFVRSHRESTPGTNVPGTSGTPSANALVAATGELTWAKARQLKKDNPTLYSSKEFRDKLLAAATKAADEGRDFYKE